MSDTEVEKVVLIGGTGRSGTTILAWLFSIHPQVASVVESWVFTASSPLLKVMVGAAKSSELTDLWEEFLTINQTKVRYSQDGQSKLLDVDAVKEMWTLEMFTGVCTDAFNQHPTPGSALESIITALFKPIAATLEKPVLVEHCPKNIGTAHLVGNALRDMVFLHVFRDPKDVFSSVRSRSWGPNTVDEFCKFYTDEMTWALKSYDCMASGVYLPVSFERLIGEPELETRRILTFAGLSVSDFPFDRIGEEVSTDQSHIGRFRESLTQDEINQIDDACGPVYRHWCEAADKCQKLVTLS